VYTGVYCGMVSLTLVTHIMSDTLPWNVSVGNLVGLK
jgi:hypothetical protein